MGDDDGTEDYYNGDFDANIEGSGNNGIEPEYSEIEYIVPEYSEIEYIVPELAVPELDDNQIEYTIDKLKPCTLYTFDLNVVGGEKDKVTTKAKTNCAESLATTSKPTGLQIQAKINDYREGVLAFYANVITVNFQNSTERFG